MRWIAIKHVELIDCTVILYLSQLCNASLKYQYCVAKLSRLLIVKMDRITSIIQIENDSFQHDRG